MNLRATAVVVLALAACAAPPSAPDYAAVVSARNRSESDRQTDQRRDPATLLAFTRVRPGMRVLDMGAGGGYSTELLARAAGPAGKVYAQDAPDANQRARERFDARMKTAAMRSVVRLERPFDDPVPPGVRDLDVVTFFFFFFFYRDTTFMPVDRAKMNRALFEALKPGGVLVIADHSAKAGDDTSVGKSLHRIEEGAVVREVEAAGFRLVERGEFLRHPRTRATSLSFVPRFPSTSSC